MAGESDTMNVPAEMPPRWAELLLEQLLASDDRQTITGDLREEYAEAILPRMAGSGQTCGISAKW